jgi:hexosaminidase
MTWHEGSFPLNSQTEFLIPGDTKANWEMADVIFGKCWSTLGYEPHVSFRSMSDKPAVYFLLSEVRDETLGNEGYQLEVSPQKIKIIANKPAGLFYGMQSLLQLIPPSTGLAAILDSTRQIPSVSIVDYPRFPWRGLMLDVSRHFFTIQEVKQYIDQMVKYKFNVFHWHLSDDQGWRVEIKSLPKLTEIGAWRVPRKGMWWSFDPPGENEKATEGGFYTQDQIRDVVKYAADRHVTILPEIDVPGHSLAMIASYPELSSTGKQYPVNPGSKFYGIDDNSLCPGKEVVFEVLDKVFTEMAQLFPGDYIHIGGDECNKSFWKTSPECQALMKREKIADLNELQSWFIKRLEKILISKGKKMIGWDEILEGGLAPEATVMSWRGMDGGIQAAKMGHQVVMTPTSNCYLDLYQGDPANEPATYSMLRLSDVYNFEPVPANVNPNLILGGQGNLWTESVATLRHAEYMTWPRGLALAEVLWSPASLRHWDGFVSRMEDQFDRFDRDHVNYSISAYDPIITMISDNGKSKISIRTEIKGLGVHYSFDESFPDQYYPHYFTPIDVPKGATRIRAVSVRDGKKIGKPISIDLKELSKRSK